MLYNIVMVFTKHWHESATGVHVSPILNSPTTNQPHPILRGCPRALALSALFHDSNLHWSSILHMVIYIFQCYSLLSSHPHLLPQSPKVCSLHLCLFYCLAYRVIIRIPGTGEPGRLQSIGSHRVGHDWSDLAVAAANSIYMC